MEFLCIFAEHLWSVKLDGHTKSVFSELFEKWRDPVYVYKFVLDHKNLLQNYFWRGLNVETIAYAILNESRELLEKLNLYYTNAKQGEMPDFDSFFEPLGLEYEEELQQSKGYGPVQ